MINFNKLKDLFPELDIQCLKDGLEAYEIEDEEEIIAFLAQAAHESGRFKHKVENLNYSAKALAATWPSRFSNPDKTPNNIALSIERKPQLIANKVYNGRGGNNKNGDDGWNYRGRGYIQLTFKNNYFDIGNSLFAVGLLDSPIELINNPDLVSQDDYAIYTAIAFWDLNCRKVYKDFKALTKKINGGLIGYEDRLKLKDEITKALK